MRARPKVLGSRPSFIGKLTTSAPSGKSIPAAKPVYAFQGPYYPQWNGTTVSYTAASSTIHDLAINVAEGTTGKIIDASDDIYVEIWSEWKEVSGDWQRHYYFHRALNYTWDTFGGTIGTQTGWSTYQSPPYPHYASMLLNYNASSELAEARRYHYFKKEDDSDNAELINGTISFYLDNETFYITPWGSPDSTYYRITAQVAFYWVTGQFDTTSIAWGSQPTLGAQIATIDLQGCFGHFSPSEKIECTYHQYAEHEKDLTGMSGVYGIMSQIESYTFYDSPLSNSGDKIEISWGGYTVPPYYWRYE